MSASSHKRSREFLRRSGQFKLGSLTTEAPHPVTANLSDVAGRDIAAALRLLFDVDDDVVNKFREFVASGRAVEISETVLHSLEKGGRIFFTGCGATGRLSILLDSVWRDFWQQVGLTCRSAGTRGGVTLPDTGQETGIPSVVAKEFENRTFSVMAGGDYALIKSVEGFEDFTAFGRKQLRDLGVRAGDVVFAITEGGETSFVIGTAWEGVEAGATVYFVYNNPDDILCRQIERSREVIRDTRIEKINLTTGPMAITGSTRMQATTIQLCVLLTILEMVVQELVGESGRDALPRVSADQPVLRGITAEGEPASPTDSIPARFLAALDQLHANLKSPELLAQLAELVALEESVYRAGHKTNYFADYLGIDVLTDTTERSPTYCTPSFRKFDDPTAAESWAFLFRPQPKTSVAWQNLLKRKPSGLAWDEAWIRPLVGEDNVARTLETMRQISVRELMRFKIGLDGLKFRPPCPGNGAVAIVSEREEKALVAPERFYRVQLEAARTAGAKTGCICFGSSVRKFAPSSRSGRKMVEVFVPIPQNVFLLDGVTRLAVKLVMNALSTCTMVRLGRVMGNTMVRVVPSNLKLIDRATRYTARLAGLTYETANRLLFDVIEYVEPRMKSDQAYPPVVGMAVLRAQHGLTNEEAEKQLAK